MPSPGPAPTVVCLQDLHWVDPSTADLVRELAAATSEPIVMVCNFRPGFSLGAPGERVVQLSELSHRQTLEQLISLLDGGEPPKELVDVVTARTDGNPFFVEEIINSLIETDVLVREPDGWVLRRPLDDVAVPGTIRGLIASRIDNLDPHRRRVLREVSVVGREFLYGLVCSVTADRTQLDGSLAALTSADLIRRRKSTDPELEYVFKHALTQEVAYDGLLRRERQAPARTRRASDRSAARATAPVSSSKRSPTTTNAAATPSRPSATSAGRDGKRSIATPSPRRTPTTAPRTISSPLTMTTPSRSTEQPGIGC